MNKIECVMRKCIIAFSCCCIFSLAMTAQAELVIVDHNHTDITQIPQSAIEQAKSTLHIVYGHTSHGSQLTTGMTGLVDFANNGGLGLSLPVDIFAYDNGGSGGGLDLHDGGMGGDVGYYPQWVNNTNQYLADHTDVNVVIWSWCGQVDGKYSAGTLDSEYLTPMEQLEEDYPNVKFVYMTGHVDIWDDADNKAANQVIRDFCNVSKVIKYFVVIIAHYDPDGTYYEYVHDNCNYYSDATASTLLGNWATEWQDSHTEGVDWYSCTSAHSVALNANRKAYAAWWLWARLGGWDGIVAPVCNDNGSCDVGETHTNCPNDCEDTDPPVRSNGSPSGDLTFGTTNVDISLNTDEFATCRYSTTADTSYDAMAATFSTTGETVHTEQITGLSNGSSYTYYVRCRDEIGNQNDNDYAIGFTVPAEDSTEVEVRVSNGNDDAEENADGSMYLTSSDLELVQDSSVQTVGIRFATVNVPQGAAISRAYIEFSADEAQSEATTLAIEAEAADNPTVFEDTTHNITSRTSTSATVAWENLPAWTIGQTYQTPDISSIVQELTDRSGWQQNNSMVFIFTGTGHRTAEAYNGNAAAAPLLHIEYSSVSAGDVNGDGALNLTDVILALQVVSGLDPVGISPAGDGDDDGHIGLTEAIMVLKELGEVTTE